MMIDPRRLLTCCRQSYQIAAGGPVPGVVAEGPSPASDALGWLSEPVGAVSGPEAIDAGFVGVLPEGIVIAIRGTLPGTDGRSFTDWLQDLCASLMPATGFPGQVHAGFFAAWLALWPPISRLVLAAADQHPDLPFIVTGHSKGGALSFLFAWSLKQAHPDRTVIVRAFAPARVGDIAFARAFNAAVPDAIRYEYDCDAVPHVPFPAVLATPFGLPAMLDYQSAGTLAYIRPSGAIVPDSAALHAERVLTLIAKAAERRFDEIAQAHSIDGPGGYLAANYPGG